MYKCCYCEGVFTSPKTVFEKHGLDTPPYEKIDTCPFCGCFEIAPALLCFCCNQYTTEECVRLADGSIYCQKCYKIISPEDVVWLSDD